MAKDPITPPIIIPQVFEYQPTTIISETDLFGTITFVNDKFCHISKFSREELIGQPHNIIRHPDMPKMLFHRLWETIKRGEVFRGVIKNKCKDGSHYWVNATIMPISDRANNTVKYLGGRHHIEDEAEAEALFLKQARALNL